MAERAREIATAEVAMIRSRIARLKADDQALL